MKLYRIWQNVNNDYDTYDSAIVCAKDEADAKTIRPDGFENCSERRFSAWCSIKHIKVELIGTANKSIKRGVILASYNAG